MNTIQDKAVHAIALAIKSSELDCSTWEMSTCRELALEIMDALHALDMYVATIERNE